MSGTVTDGALLTDFVPGDLNADNFTGIDDLNIVLGEWNTDGSGDPRSDPSGDEYVGVDDLNTVQAQQVEKPLRVADGRDAVHRRPGEALNRPSK